MIKLVCLCYIFSINSGCKDYIPDDAETRNRFSSKSICSYGIDVLEGTDFGCCVSLTDEGSVVEGDSVTVVSTLRYICVGGGYADGGKAVVFDGESYLC